MYATGNDGENETLRMQECWVMARVESPGGERGWHPVPQWLEGLVFDKSKSTSPEIGGKVRVCVQMERKFTGLVVGG